MISPVQATEDIVTDESMTSDGLRKTTFLFIYYGQLMVWLLATFVVIKHGKISDTEDEPIQLKVL